MIPNKIRHSKNNLCPVCGFWDNPAGRGRGTRCSGFTFSGDDGNTYAICSREQSPKPIQGDGWTHWIDGPCNCGNNHGGQDREYPRKEPESSIEKVSQEVMTRLTHDGIEYEHIRVNYADKRTGETSKSFFWSPTPGTHNHSPTDFRLHQPPGQTIVGADEVVVITEGQKDANAVYEAGYKSVGIYGANCIPNEVPFRMFLHSAKHLIFWSDCDTPGREAMRTMYSLARKYFPDARLSIIENPSGIDKQGAADITVEDRKKLLESTISLPQEESKQGRIAKVFKDSYPAPLPNEAFFGIPRSIIEIAEPFTEADRQAVYASVITGLGLLAGINCGIEGAIGMPQLFTLVVGESGDARKGTSWKLARKKILEPVMEAMGMLPWEMADFFVDGFASGEGGVSQFDPPVGADEPKPEGIQKFFVSDEFATALINVNRQGSTLSPFLRQLYDNVDMNIPTRRGGAPPLTALNPHGAVLGFITDDELRSIFDARQAMNGLLNRFLLVPVKRSKSLPIEMRKVPLSGFDAAIEQLAELAKLAAYEHDVDFTPDGAELWNEIYTDRDEFQSQQGNAFYAAATKRYTDHLGKLALINALYDPDRLRMDIEPGDRYGSQLIKAKHIEAAKYWADRSVEAVAWIWRASFQLTEKEESIINYLANQPHYEAQRSAIRNDALGGKMLAGELTDLSHGLVKKGWISVAKDQIPGQKPPEIWTLLPNRVQEI